MKKTEIIKQIKSIVKEHGTFTTADVQAESSPSVGNVKGINQLAETFYENHAEIVTYDRNDNEIGSDPMKYEDMTKDTLLEILELTKTFESNL